MKTIYSTGIKRLCACLLGLSVLTAVSAQEQKVPDNLSPSLHHKKTGAAGKSVSAMQNQGNLKTDKTTNLTKGDPDTALFYGVELNSQRLIRFSPDSPGNFIDIGPAGSEWYGIAFADNDFSTLYVLDNAAEQLILVDTVTIAQTVIGNCSPLEGHVWTGLTSDPRDGTLYASSSDILTSAFYEVDKLTGDATLLYVTDALPCVIDIAISPEGDLYGIDIAYNVLFVVPHGTMTLAVLGNVGIDANYAQGLDFDQAEGILYWAACGGATDSGLRTLDLETGASTLTGNFPGNAELELAIAKSGKDPADDLKVSPYKNFVAEITPEASGEIPFSPIEQTYELFNAGENSLDWQAVYTRQDGTWQVLMSGSGYTSLKVPRLLGGPDWEPVPGDYDGDGKADPAVRKDDGSVWKVMLSGSGYYLLQAALDL